MRSCCAGEHTGECGALLCAANGYLSRDEFVALAEQLKRAPAAGEVTCSCVPCCGLWHREP